MVNIIWGDKDMPNYKEMYIKMVRASEKALDILIAAQQECEELYTTNSPELKAVPFSAENDQTMEKEKC